MGQDRTKKQSKTSIFLEKWLDILEKVLLLSIISFGIFLIIVLFISYILTICLKNWDVAGKIYLPVTKLIVLIHQNWIIIVPTLILIFCRPIYRLIDEITEISTKWGGVKRSSTEAQIESKKFPIQNMEKE